MRKHANIFHFRCQPSNWDFIHRGAVGSTVTRIMLIGGITEALLLLLESGVDVSEHIKSLDDCDDVSMRYLDDSTPSVMSVVRKRLHDHGYTTESN